MTERTEFLDLLGELVSYVQNERVRAYNEGVDETLDAIRRWARLNVPLGDIRGDNVPDLLGAIKKLLGDGE